MCIARFLASVVSPRATAITRQDRRNRAIYDYTICFGVPAIAMACHVLYQPSRYMIIENVGCAITALLGFPTLLFWLVWPPVFVVCGTLYSSMSHHFAISVTWKLTVRAQSTSFTGS